MPKDITLFLFDIKFSMDVSSVLWVRVFSYLDEKDQASMAGVCHEWWKMIFGKLLVLREAEWQELDISGTGRLYRFIPLKMFSTLECLNLSKKNDHECSFSADGTGGEEFAECEYF